MRRIYGLTIPLLLLAALPVYAVPVDFVATLTGPNEVPPTTSPGIGFALVTFDPEANTLRVQATFSGLVSATDTGAPSGVTAAHIHCCLPPPPAPQVAGVATVLPIFTGFPMGPTVRSGSYDRTFDTEPAVAADTYNPAFVAANGGTVAAAEAVLFAGMLAGRTYFNIHTNQFPGGEIRGTLLATPEPGTLLLLAAGLAGVGVRTRTRRHAA